MKIGDLSFSKSAPLDRRFSLIEAASHDPLPIGGVAAGLMLGTYALLGIAPDIPLLILAACGTTLIYLADRTFGLSPEDEHNRPGRVAWIQSRRRYLWGLGIGAAVLGGTMIPFLRPATLGLGGGVGLLGVAYVMPVLPGRRRLKALGRTKPLLIAGAWAGGGVVLPVVEAGAAFLSLEVAALVGYRICWVLPNVMMADWGDRAGDAAANIHTLGTSWTESQLRVVASSWTLLGFLGAVGSVVGGSAPFLLVVDASGLIFLFFGLWKLHPGRHPEHALVADLLVGWPLVTALWWWLAI